MNQPTTHSPGRTRVSGYRRNGKLKSCEPCRKSKLRCDHSLPICGRCLARRQGDRCVYHPNPLSREPQSNIVEPNTQGSVISSNLPGGALGSSEESSIEPCDQVPDVHPEQVITELPLQTRDESVTIPQAPETAACLNSRRSPTFLGATSFSSIRTESLNNVPHAFSNAGAAGKPHDEIPADLIAHGCRAMSFLTDRTVIDHGIERWYRKSEGSFICPESVMSQWLHGLWRHYEHSLHSPNSATLPQLCQDIWASTKAPLRVDKQTQLSEWASNCTGHHLRWQVIGLVATAVGLCIVAMPPSDEFFMNHNIARDTLLNNMVELSQSCVGFCRTIDAVDDLFIWLLYERVRLLRAVKGEGCYETYRAGGETIDALVALGLHQSDYSTDNIPFFLVELRKRLVCGVCALETSTAAFLGRPKRLQYRYIHIEAPLDLRDQQIALEGSELAAALTSLHPDGFNNDKRLHRTTWLRMWLPFDQIREEILDLALGKHTVEDVLLRAGSIQKRSENQWSRLPLFMREAGHQLTQNRLLPPLEVLYRTFFQQDYHSNELLLQRVLILKTGATPERLVGVAQRILRDVLLITQRHDIGTMFEMDFVFLLIMHGLRSAAVLAVELLKQEQRRTSSSNALLPRSRTIQDLSVFAARLGAVDPSNHGFGICEQGRRVIVFILDQILNPETATAVQNSSSSRILTPRMDTDDGTPQSSGPTGDLGSGVFANINLDQIMGSGFTITLGSDHDFVQWLENFNWGFDT